MIDDIMARLRDKWRHREELCYEAAGEIERLRAVVSQDYEVGRCAGLEEAAKIARFHAAMACMTAGGRVQSECREIEGEIRSLAALSLGEGK